MNSDSLSISVFITSAEFLVDTAEYSSCDFLKGKLNLSFLEGLLDFVVTISLDDFEISRTFCEKYFLDYSTGESGLVHFTLVSKKILDEFNRIIFVQFLESDIEHFSVLTDSLKNLINEELYRVLNLNINDFLESISINLSKTNFTEI